VSTLCALLKMSTQEFARLNPALVRGPLVRAGAVVRAYADVGSPQAV